MHDTTYGSRAPKTNLGNRTSQLGLSERGLDLRNSRGLKPTAERVAGGDAFIPEFRRRQAQASQAA